MDSTVTGSVTVDPGGALYIRGSTIDGAVVATNPSWIKMDNLDTRHAVVKGSMTVDGTTGLPPSTPYNYICIGTQIGGSLVVRNSGAIARWAIGFCGGEGDKIGGSVTLTGNHAEIKFENNRVGSSMTATGNSGPSSDIENNVIGGSLTVKHNVPCWVVGSNTVSGAQSVDACS